MDRNVYIIISKTYTRFGGVIRAIGRVRYNHTSIVLDEDFKEIYAFARQRHKVLLTGRLVKENVSRFTFDKRSDVDVAVFKIPVTDEQYARIKEIVDKVYRDPDYIYNLFSVLTYPLTKGISVYKAFTCIEFVMYLLKEIGYDFKKPLPAYKPDDLLVLLSKEKIYQGNLLDILEEKQAQTDYFDSFRFTDLVESIRCTSKLLYRTATLRHNELY